MSLANISIVGNLVRHPEQVCFATGRVKTTLIVAVNNRFRQRKNGDDAEFYKVETWGRLAEAANKYLQKGNQLTVSGRLVFDHWTDKYGRPRISPVIEADQLAFPPRLSLVNADSDEVPGEPSAVGEDIYIESELVSAGRAVLSGVSIDDAELESLANERGPASLRAAPRSVSSADDPLLEVESSLARSTKSRRAQ